MSLFSLRITSLRKEKGESQENVADYLGLNRTTYSAYERGKIVPPFEKIQKLADHYHVSVPYIMGRDNNKDYTVSKSSVPNIIEQLNVILDELKDELVIVKANDYELTDTDKKELLPFISSCLSMVKVFEMKGSK